MRERKAPSQKSNAQTSCCEAAAQTLRHHPRQSSLSRGYFFFVNSQTTAQSVHWLCAAKLELQSHSLHQFPSCEVNGTQSPQINAPIQRSVADLQ